MKLVVSLAGLFAAVALSTSAIAQTPPENPYPASKLNVFVAAQTVTQEGALSNFYIRGATVVFRAYAAHRRRSWCSSRRPSSRSSSRSPASRT